MLEGFVLTVLAVMIGFVLAAILLTVIMMNKKVMKWYIKKSKKMTEMIMEEMDF